MRAFLRAELAALEGALRRYQRDQALWRLAQVLGALALGVWLFGLAVWLRAPLGAAGAAAVLGLLLAILAAVAGRAAMARPVKAPPQITPPPAPEPLALPTLLAVFSAALAFGRALRDPKPPK